MLARFLLYLVCPVTQSPLETVALEYGTKSYKGSLREIIKSGVLLSETGWMYPVIDGVPRMQVEAFLDFEEFLSNTLKDYQEKKQHLLMNYSELINAVKKKNKRTKESFELEWKIFDYGKDNVWELGKDELLNRFLKETNETKESLNGKLVFDAGCGNGLLDKYIADCGATVIGLDFSRSIDRAEKENDNENVFFVQGDIEYPPFANQTFDLIQCSGVLVHTPDPARAFSIIDRFVKLNGRMSVWLYHPRKDFIHNSINKIRNRTSKLPLKFQYNLYRVTLFPLSLIWKRLKGNKQNRREMMISIMDWFSPEFRWEFTHDEARAWFDKKNYQQTQITTSDTFGFNITGIKSDN